VIISVIRSLSKWSMNQAKEYLEQVERETMGSKLIASRIVSSIPEITRDESIELLNRFGSVVGILRQKVDALVTTPNLAEEKALHLYQYFIQDFHLL